MPWEKQRQAAAIYRTPEHKRTRAALVKDFREGDPCCLCGHPMHGPTRYLHADHDPADPTRYRGLAHGTRRCPTCGVRCNVVDGARRGRARQSRQNQGSTTLRW